MSLLQNHLHAKIAQIETDRWGDRHAPVVRISADVNENDADGFTAGSIEVWTPLRSGDLILFLTVSLSGIRDVSSADDCLAEAISKALAQHGRWARQQPEN
jgi:hypothetical protein